MGAAGRIGEPRGGAFPRVRPARTEPGPAADGSGDRRDFWVMVLKGRLIATALLPLAVVAFPIFGPHRFVLAAAAVVLSVAANLNLLHRVRAGRPVRGLLATVDTAAILLALAVLPEVYAAGIILVTATSALYIFWFGGALGPRLLVPTTAALLVIGLWHQPHMWVPAFVAHLATAAIAAVPISRMAAAAVAIRNRYDDMLNGVDAVLWEGHGESLDADYVSDGASDLLGVDPDSLRSFEGLLAHVLPEDRRGLIDNRRLAATGTPSDTHFGFIDSSGRTRRMHERITVSGTCDASRRRRGVIVDETDRWIAQRKLRAYADFVEGLPIPLSILRLDDRRDPRSIRVAVANPAAATMVGRRQEDVVGRPLSELLDLSDTFVGSLADVVLNEEILERSNLRIDELGAVFDMRAVPLPGDCIGLMLEDVTDRADRSRSLKHQATHDHLTGLANRAMFNDRLARALGRTRLDGRQVAVLMIDLNQFKEVNDTLGHEVGDLLLVELADRLSRDMRYCDTIARLGGDEFAVLLTDSVDEASATGAARRVLELCEEPFEVEGFRLQIGASIGIARAPEHSEDARTLMRQADRAMYRAKEAGGGITSHSPSQIASELARIGLLEDLRGAVDADQLVVHYQPRFDLGTERVLGVEALVRWDHPTKGLLGPGDFLALAEASGDIDALTRSVTRRAVSEISALGSGDELVLNINLSERTLRDDSLVDWVRALIESGAYPPHALCFEVAERRLLHDPDRAAVVLSRLHDLGTRIGIDDFGTGGTAVTRLRELPVDEVKIDALLLSGLDRDTRFLRSVVDLCHALDVHVVAEGVEDARSLDAVRSLGCDSAQGFHLAAPMPYEQLAAHLDAGLGAGREPAVSSLPCPRPST